MTHVHQFVHIEEVSKPGPAQAMRGITGARVGCPECAEIRVVWSTGELIVEHPGHVDTSNS